MKVKVLAFTYLLFVVVTLQAQDLDDSGKNLSLPSNEVSINAFDLIVGGILPINYERYLNNNQSIAFKAFLFDKHYNDMTESNYGTFSLQGQYMIYFFDRKDHYGLYVAPFAKYTTGTASNDYYQYSSNGNSQLIQSDYAVNAIIAGFGVGYKFVVKNKFTFNVVTDLGRVLNQGKYYGYSYSYDGLQNEFSEYGPVEFRFGVNMGYRF